MSTFAQEVPLPLPVTAEHETERPAPPAEASGSAPDGDAAPDSATSDRAAPDIAPASPSTPAPPAHRPRVVALLNQKGGVGKTTSTVNLGAALARYGRRVLLVDLDPQSNLSLHFGVEPREDQPSVHDLLVDPAVRVDDVALQARPGLDFIPAVTELALVEGELAHRPDMQHALRLKLEPVFERYDVVLLDCPPSLGVLSVNALTVADEVFVPMQAHYLPLRGLEKLLQTVHLVAQGLNPRIRVTGVLLCMHEGLSGHARAVIAEIEAQLAQFRGTDLPWADARVLSPPVRRNIKLAEAPSFGQTIFDYAPRCPGAEDYRCLAEGLMRGWGLEPGEFAGRRARRAPDTAAAEPGDGEAAGARAKQTSRRAAGAGRKERATVRTKADRATGARTGGERKPAKAAKAATARGTRTGTKAAAPARSTATRSARRETAREARARTGTGTRGSRRGAGEQGAPRRAKGSPTAAPRRAGTAPAGTRTPRRATKGARAKAARVSRRAPEPRSRYRAGGLSL
jgi:chromosome partitioning protein